MERQPARQRETYRDINKRLRQEGYERRHAIDRFYTPDMPRPGYFKRRLEPRSQIWLPASIYNEICFDPESGDVLDRPQYLAAEVCGSPDEVEEVWWMWEIDEEEYKWLTMLSEIRIQNDST